MRIKPCGFLKECGNSFRKLSAKYSDRINFFFEKIRKNFPGHFKYTPLPPEILVSENSWHQKNRCGSKSILKNFRIFILEKSLFLKWRCHGIEQIFIACGVAGYIGGFSICLFKGLLYFNGYLCGNAAKIDCGAFCDVWRGVPALDMKANI